jgi:spore maturation protein CgeB
MYPNDICWPSNVDRIDHVPPAEHREFYNSQHYTLNVTRADMVRAGYSPSVRLFEAAACGVPIISDYWDGLERLLAIGKEILVARSPQESLTHMRELSEAERRNIGEAARKRVLARHTAAHRAAELEQYVTEAQNRPKSRALRVSLSTYGNEANVTTSSRH